MILFSLAGFGLDLFWFGLAWVWGGKREQEQELSRKDDLVFFGWV